MGQISGQPILPTSVAAAAAGLASAERVTAREQAKAGQGPRDRLRRAADSADLRVVDTETAEAVRDTKGNDKEEGRQDRREHAAYTAEELQKKHIDVEG